MIAALCLIFIRKSLLAPAAQYWAPRLRAALLILLFRLATACQTDLWAIVNYAGGLFADWRRGLLQGDSPSPPAAPVGGSSPSPPPTPAGGFPPPPAPGGGANANTLSTPSPPPVPAGALAPPPPSPAGELAPPPPSPAGDLAPPPPSPAASGGSGAGPQTLGGNFASGNGDVTDSTAIAQATSTAAGGEVAQSAATAFAAGEIHQLVGLSGCQMSDSC